MDQRDRQLKQEYRRTPTPAGVYQIRNRVNGKVLVGVSNNLPGILNRHAFQLKLGSHRNATLQADWNSFGADSFAFEVLDELPPHDDPSHDPGADLAVLEELWLDDLRPYDDRGYNQRKIDDQERLRLIIAARQQ